MSWPPTAADRTSSPPCSGALVVAIPLGGLAIIRVRRGAGVKTLTVTLGTRPDVATPG